MPNDPAATLAGVVFTYDGARGRVEALRGVDLEVRRGELTALLGVNGSGKSTLLRLLAAVATPSAGRVEVLGLRLPQAARRIRRELRRRLAYVEQDAALDPEMYVGEILELMATLHGLTGSARAARVAALLERFDLAALTARRVDELSGGQRRRLHLAAGLVHEPELVLLDEPAAGLDATGTDALWYELVRRADSGDAVVLVTHELAAAERHADRAVLLEAGRIVADGAPAQLVADHGAPHLGEVFRKLTGHDPEELVPEPAGRGKRR